MLDFDERFYQTYYPDLHAFEKREDLLEHYNRYGKSEGRFPSLEAAQAHFEALNGPPPADFDVKIYAQLNPDLARLFSSLVQYELHFLQYGRFEERAYKSVSGRQEEAWEQLLNVHDFNLLNQSWLPRGGVDRAQAVALMGGAGLARLAPIARAWIFDPTFYRANYGARGDDAVLYADWLHAGFPAGRAPNEVRAIFPLLAGRPYPENFDWRLYCNLNRIEASSPSSIKIDALESLFEQPLDESARACIAAGPDAARLYEALGDYALVRARFRQAADAFGLAVAGEQTARRRLRLGDALLSLGDAPGALTSFRHALSLPGCSIWALIHAVKILLSQGEHREALELVRMHADRFRADELFAGFVDDVADIAYRDVAETMRAMISDNEETVALDAYADDRLGHIIAFLRAVKIGDRSLRVRPTEPRRVAMLACLDLAQCTFYRVEQKRRLLEAAGIELEVFDFNNPAPFMSALPGAAAAIFYRVPCYPKIVESILYANALGIETFYDIDDLVFTRDFPDSYESYEKQISREVYNGLCHGVALYRQTISLCRGAIVSTRPLAETIAPMVTGGANHTFVVPNGLDDRSARAARFADCKGPPGDSLSIFYGTGTKAHNADFSEIVGPALLEVLERYRHVRLVIVGYLRLDARFEFYEKRITHIPFISDIDTYWAVLASCDINIAVLHQGPIADCKSEIKWLEGAMLAIPSIVSATAAYRDILTDGETGMLAASTEEWARQLRLLIEDEELRRRIGAAARKLAFREYGATAIVAKLKTALADPLAKSPRELPATGSKPRLLICNVYFAPQSIGGATRVVENNIAELLARYHEDFEISILSTFKGMEVGALRVDAQFGCPVYRIGTPVEVNMDWRPFNEAILPAFRRVLAIVQPDLVHFHCIQRLTASIVEETLLAKIPYVVTVHDAWWISDHQFLVDQDDRLVNIDDPFHTPLPSGVRRPEALHRRQRLKSLINAAAATLAVSPSFADLYRRAGIGNVKVCENGLSQLPAPLAKTTPPAKIVLGHIGGRSAHKGASLIEAVLKQRDYRNLELVMTDGTLSPGQKQIERWGSTWVTLHAPVPSDQVDQLYAGIDVLLAPSIWPESYGLVVREAMHFRTWVVVSDRGALAQDVVNDRNGFIIDPSDPGTLAAVFDKIDNNLRRFKKPPAATKLRSVSQQVDEIVAVYRETLRNMPSPYVAQDTHVKHGAPIM